MMLQKHPVRIVLGVLAMAADIAPAQASKTVTSTGIVKGETSLEWKGEMIADSDDDSHGAWKTKIAAGHGVTAYWNTEIEANVERGGAPGGAVEFTNIDWKNKFLLTPPGRFAVDAGARVSYGYNTEGGADTVEVKFLFSKDAQTTAHRANLSLEREIGGGADNAVDWGLSWSSLYKHSDVFRPGVELHSDFGRIGDEGDFDEQDHRMGPVFYGRFGHELSYDLGYLVGLSDAAPDGTVKAIVKYRW